MNVVVILFIVVAVALGLKVHSLDVKSKNKAVKRYAEGHPEDVNRT